MNTEEFNYHLPSELIAQHPLTDRSDSKLLILNRQNGRIKHEKFKNIINYLTREDVLVLNNTKVIPARIYGIKKETKAKIEILLLKEIENNLWECLVKHQKRVKIGTIIDFSPSLSAEVVKVENEGITYLKMIYNGNFYEILSECGVMPTPPYIHEELKEKDRYQTVYAEKYGSVAAPTAGLHFTEELLNKIKEKGVTLVYITLNVGIGTFRPVTVEDATKHKMHSELYEIDSEAAEILNRSKNEGKRIICVGTTSVRTLESNFKKYGKFKETKEETDIFIYPGYKFLGADSIITNFHLPKSTLLMLVSAFSKKKYIMNAYEEAISNKYRFFSFGDAMFINNVPAKKRKLYKNTLKEFKKLKPVLKKENFKIYKGTTNIMLSAPHAFKQEREGSIKKNEYNTGKLCKLMHVFTGCHIIFTYKNLEIDHNYNETEYKKELSKYIKENNIKYLIDVHGLETNEKYNLIIGTNKYKNLNDDKKLLNNIIKIFKNNLSKKIESDKKYKASEKTISYYINKNNNIKTMQFEISKKYRKFKKRPLCFNKLVNSMIKTIELLERWDK